MVSIAATLKVSLRALTVNKARSLLTMLGIVIGVAAVIAMLAIGTGASMKIEAQMTSIGSNLLMVLSGTTTSGGARMGWGSNPSLTVDDAEAIKKEIPSVQEAAPIVRRAAQIVYGGQNWSTGIIGTTEGYSTVRDWNASSGRWFTGQETRSASKVCLLGRTVVEKLFMGEHPVGNIIRIKNVPFTVIGVLDAKGQSPMGDDQDDIAIVPLPTAQKRLFGSNLPGVVNMIMVKAKSADALADAEEQINRLLRQRHRIGPKQDQDFSVRNFTQMMEAAEQAAKIMTILLGAIASVSLIVGGIGIMNIMLVSVTERTREIGIRMAVGARKWDIRLQFLIEAATLSLIGGIIGFFIGVGSSMIFTEVTGWPAAVSALHVVLAFGFSALVGIVFGYYPAYKASLLNPIEALRYE